MSSMEPNPHQHSPQMVALIGLAALGSAMGVGRFAFTPLFPLMQAAGALSLSQGSWLASANYVGYLLGALACSVVPPAPHNAVRLGLAAVAMLTLAMGASATLEVWIGLRFAAGVASAYVLVGVAAWALPALVELRRPAWSGWVFSGVGIGIGIAGLVGLVAGTGHYDPAYAWLILGAASAGVAAIAWVPVRARASRAVPVPRPSPRLDARDWRLVLAYGSFGFGYIIPATFLPAMARDLIDDPAVFGWIWPAFGMTAAASTIVAALCVHGGRIRRIWALGLLIMAAGVLAPALVRSVGSLLVAAVCVGGTFMVTTMAGIQEARRIAGSHAQRLIAVMTAAFALGQVAGPLVVAAIASLEMPGIAIPSLLAATALALGAWTLWRPEPMIVISERKQA